MSLDQQQLAEVIAARRHALAPAGTRLVGLTGGVAAGKSTLAAALREPLARVLGGGVEVVGSDGFLQSDQALRARGLLHEKGFPESHDRDAILRFAGRLNSDAREVEVPLYSHATRSVDGARTVALPCTLIVEGVFAFELLRASALPHVGIYLDASEDDLERFYLTRWSHLLADHGDFVRGAWRDVNLPNLRLHISKERAHAELVLHKAADHTITVR
ncbi:MAG TPA: hypothetical protein VFX59_23300 [Polyangiales bacterium]|nr:hypothetical protein [Polyangiales bacterium]